MKIFLALLLLLCRAAVCASAAEPTELREWSAKTGHKLEAKAVQVTEGKVQFERADGSKIVIALEKLTDADQADLGKHFGLADASEPAAKVDAAPAGAPADDLPHPLGKATGEISCGDEYSYFLYLPTSLRKGVKHPVVFVMNPGGGGPGDANRYRTGAERNRWIIAISKQSKNGFDASMNAVDSMIAHVTSKLPIDQKRMYTTGFSGGSRMAFLTATKYKEIAGVIPCGAGGNVGSARQIVYGLCGSNCFNRTDMANSFKGFKSKDSVLRYFPGKHNWANEELCGDAITHLNGVFLTSNRTKYPDDYAHYVQQVMALIAECEAGAPMRAYQWTTFLTDHGVKDPKLASSHAALGQNEANKLFVKGIADINEFAQKTFGTMSASQWQSDPKVSAACKREAGKYVGTPWEEVLKLMSEDAQKF